MDFYYDSALGVAICIPCQTGMVPGGKEPFKNHLRAEPHHLTKGAFKSTREYLIRLQLRSPSEVPYPSPAEQPVEAIPHLKVHHGYYCSHCHDWRSINESKTRDHVTSIHHIRTRRQRQGYKPCLLQTIFKSPGLIRWFRVFIAEQDPRAAQLARIDVSQDPFLAQQRQVEQDIATQEKKQADLVVGSNGHPADVPLWVQSCGFARYLKGCSKSELLGLSKKPSPEDESDAAIRKILQVVAEMLKETWNWCLDGPSCRLTRPMAVVLSQFWTVANVHSKGFRPGIDIKTFSTYIEYWQNAFTFLWTTEIRDRWPTRRDPEQDDQDDQDDQDTDPIADRDFFQCTPEQLDHLYACSNAVHDGDDDALREHVFALSLALIRHPLPGYRFESALLSYCATISQRAGTETWQPAGDFNHHLSALIYCAQLWIFRSVCHRIDQDPCLDADEELASACQKWFRQERSTTFGIILNWRLMLFRVGKQDVVPRFATWSLDNQEVCYKGTNISMAQVSQLYRQAVREARQILDRDLLLGADHLVRMSSEHLLESEHRQEMNWWFAKDPRNETLLQGHTEALLNHTLGVPLLRQTYLEPREGQVRFRPEAIGLYVYAIQQFLQRWFAAFQVSSPPLRAKDILAITWRNTERPRSIYVKHGRVMVYVNHHKSQGHWGQTNDNVRFLPVELGDMLLDFLVFVTPHYGRMIWQVAPGTLLSSSLWVRDGQLWKETGLTRYLRAASVRAEGPPLGLSHWRHISASIIKVKFGEEAHVFDVDQEDGDSDDPDRDDGEDEVVATMVRQSNHSVRTHNRAYANSTGLPVANVWDGLIKRAFRASLLWATFFRFGEEESEHVAVGSRRRRRRESMDDGRGLVKRIARAIPTPRRHWTGPALLREARRLMQNDHLEWRCPEQAQAMCAVAAGAPEVVAVLATGTGKSLLFQLACSLPGAHTTILVVPLVALRLDLLKHCRQMGIDCEEWRPGSRTQAPLVFVSVEHAGQGSFYQYLYELHQARQLDRVVIDECHLVLTAAIYRRRMSKLVVLRGIQVPFVYLTATLPVYLQQRLYQHHHLTKVVEIRGPSRRPNLRYRVQRSRRQEGTLLISAATTIQQRWAEQYDSGNGPQRCLIFTRSKKDSEEVAGLLGCDYYHADVGEGDPEAKGEILTRWMAGGEGPFLVGTSGLGAGLNYPSVRLVVHIDEPYSLVAFSQESGRGGRDQQAAESLVLLPEGWQPPLSSLVDVDEAALHEFLVARGCRRPILSQHLDIPANLARCGEGEEMCDGCEAGRSEVGVDKEGREETSKGAGEEEMVVRPVADTIVGPVMLLRGRMQDQREWDQYLERLKGLQGQCIMCRLGGREWRHGLNSCKHPDKWVFIHAKKELLEQRRPRWITPYSACYRCFQPQSVCEVGVGGGSCEYPDVVMPGMVALWLGVAHQQWLQERWQVNFNSATECLRWAGQRDQMGEEVCVRGVRVIAQMMQKLG